MKPLLQFCCLISLVYVVVGCGGGKHSTSENANTASAADVKIPVPVATKSKVIKDEKDLIGYWVGPFREDAVFDSLDHEDASVWDIASKINISIDAINGSQVSGHSIDSGIFRPFAGTMEHTGSTYHFSVKGPGDSPFDGAFSFSIKTGDTVLTGTWTSNKKIAIPVRYFDLTKKFFRYNPDLDIDAATYVDTKKVKEEKFKDSDGTEYSRTKYAMATNEYARYNASAKLLTTDQVANLKAADLLLLRNYIFARHGYAFKKPALQSFFDQQDWYIPISTNVIAELTPIEKQNITLIMRYEKNAKQYYDTFGR